jgi:peptidoglycan/xylan/chitin deacetylase (PgdA/CDA1 family)
MKRLFLLLLLAGCSAPAYRLDGSSIDSSRWLDKPILLTIDDAPQDAATDAAMLAILAKHHAKAVWFVNCKNFDPANPHAAENAATLRRIAAAGHEVGSHGYSHLHLDKLHGDALRHEIGGCSDALAAILHRRPTLFRPPWGVSSPEADAEIKRAGMVSMLWSQNTYDSMLPSFKHQPNAYSDFLRGHEVRVSAGDILLMHDYAHTARNLDAILTGIEAQGFHFVMPTRR